MASFQEPRVELEEASRRPSALAPVAQLDRASASGAEGQKFESSRVRSERSLTPRSAHFNVKHVGPESRRLREPRATSHEPRPSREPSPLFRVLSPPTDSFER